MQKTYGFKQVLAMRYSTQIPIQKNADSGNAVVGSAALSCYIVLQYVQIIVRLHSECYLEIVRNNVYFKLITFG